MSEHDQPELVVELEMMEELFNLRIEAGTRCATTIVPLIRSQYTDSGRLQAELRGRAAVIEAFRQEWPDHFTWDFMNFSIAHTTSQVLVQLRSSYDDRSGTV